METSNTVVYNFQSILSKISGLSLISVKCSAALYFKTSKFRMIENLNVQYEVYYESLCPNRNNESNFLIQKHSNVYSMFHFFLFLITMMFLFVLHFLLCHRRICYLISRPFLSSLHTDQVQIAFGLSQHRIPNIF